MEKDLDYENNNIGYDHQYPEGGIKCKNYELCECVLPKWWFECKGCYLCINCLISRNGQHEISDNVDCPICFEKKRGLKYPNCNHKICVDCYKRCYYGDNNRENEPKFPYPSDIEDEYDSDQYNVKWETEYPLIKKWNDEWNEWDDNRQYKYHDENYLRICSLCRN